MKFELPKKLLDKLPGKPQPVEMPKAKTRLKPTRVKGFTQKDKNIIKVIILIIFMFVGAFQGMFFYINDKVKPELYEKQIVEDLRNQTGQAIEINGGVRFSLLPTPKLIISNITLGDKTEESRAPLFYLGKIEIGIALNSLLSEKIQLTSVTLVDPALHIKRYEDNKINWGWLNTRLLKLFNNKNGAAISLPIHIMNGVINYQDIANNKIMEIKAIEAHSLVGSASSIQGVMTINNNIFGFVLDNNAEGMNLKETEFPMNIKLADGGKNNLKVNGIIDPSGDLPKIFGTFSFNSTDVDSFFDLISKMSNQKEAIGDNQASPVNVTGAWNLNDDVVDMSDLEIDMLNSKGKGSASLRWTKWYPTISTDLDFDNIDYIAFNTLIERRITKRVVKQNEENEDVYEEVIENYDFRKENPLPENIEIKLNIDAKKIIFNKEIWKNTQLNATLDNGAFTINQFDIKLDGEGVLSIFGVISQGGTGQLRFEGNMESSGKSLREAISMFYSAAKDLPPLSLGNFDIKANMYITAGQIRLFETMGSVDGINLAGTITIFLESTLRMDMALKMEDVNFDYIRDTLREKQLSEKKDAKNNQKKTQDKYGFDWLKYLSIRIDAKIIVERFTFMERAGDRASLSLYAHRGDLRVSDLRFEYPEAVDDLNFIIDARGKLPFINLMINFEKIDTSYFNLNIDPSDTETIPVESTRSLLQKENLERAVQLDWMDGFNGVFDITLGKLIHNSLVMDKIKFQAKLDNKIMTIQKFGFIFTQAQSYIVGTIFGGKVPGMNISFTMANADLYELIQPLTGLTNISGFSNLSGNIATSGWSYLEWLQHSDAKLLMTARGVKVQGININGVTNVIEVARSSADVFNNVNNILTKGSSEFSIDGALNIKDGELRSPNLSLRSGLVTGLVIGGLKLEKMEGQFSANFRFPNLSSEAIPFLIIQLTGNMHKPELKVDTQSLESFVAKRNIIH